MDAHLCYRMDRLSNKGRSVKVGVAREGLRESAFRPCKFSFPHVTKGRGKNTIHRGVDLGDTAHFFPPIRGRAVGIALV